MEPSKLLEEELREAACNGDADAVTKLVSKKSVDVNSRNSVNGW